MHPRHGFFLALLMLAFAIPDANATDNGENAKKVISQHDLMLNHIISPPSDPRPAEDGTIPTPPTKDPDNYCPYAANSTECQKGFELGLRTGAPAGVFDGLTGIEGRQSPTELPETFEDASYQEGYVNGVTVGYYRGSAWGLGQNLGLWEGMNDCLKGAPKKEVADMVYEGWLIELATTGTDDQKKFAAQVMEGWIENYSAGFTLCENNQTETMEAFALQRGIWNGQNNYLKGIDDKWFGKPERIDQNLAAIYLVGYEKGRALAAENAERGEAVDFGPYRYDHAIPWEN